MFPLSLLVRCAVPVRPYVWRRPPAAGHHLLGTIYLILNITHHISHRKFSAYRVLSMCKEDGSNEYKCSSLRTHLPNSVPIKIAFPSYHLSQPIRLVVVYACLFPATCLVSFENLKSFSNLTIEGFVALQKMKKLGVVHL